MDVESVYTHSAQISDGGENSDALNAIFDMSVVEGLFHTSLLGRSTHNPYYLSTGPESSPSAPAPYPLRESESAKGLIGLSIPYSLKSVFLSPTKQNKWRPNHPPLVHTCMSVDASGTCSRFPCPIPRLYLPNLQWFYPINA